MSPPAGLLGKVARLDPVRSGEGPTTRVRPEVAVAEPFLFFAVTLTRSAAPTSAVVSVYVLFLAPGTRAHLLAATWQRFQW